MPNVYTPVRHGFGQSAVYDQMAAALPGSLAFASDLNLVDSFIAGPAGPDGLAAGRAVAVKEAADASRPGINSLAVVPLDAAAVPAQVAGILVRTQQMSANAAGEACVFEGELCNVARIGRSGARIWARLASGAAPAFGEPARVVLSGPEAGCLSSGAGDAGAPAVPGIRFLSEGVNGVALVELF